MQRLRGSYSISSQELVQADHQIIPRQFIPIGGHHLPIGGAFSQVVCTRGEAALYVSQPGEVPLYFSTTPGAIHWSEQKLSLPGKKISRVQQGQLVLWQPGEIYCWNADTFPRPAIRSDNPTIEEAIAEYKLVLIQAVKRRLVTCNSDRVAVSQSGGVDSLLITWALLACGVEVVPMTVCTSLKDLDIKSALPTLKSWGMEVIPIVVEPPELESLTHEALICHEEPEDYNVRMAMGNILMARKCQEMGIRVIFNGHGQDDVFGKGTLVKSVLAEQRSPSKTEAEAWRDTRRLVTAGTSGMVKMFSASFRRYGIQVRMPYYDADLLTWAFSQPISILPIEFKKEFVHAVAASALPPGPWLDRKHSVGYLTGAGLSLTGTLFKNFPGIREPALRSALKVFSHLPLQERMKLSLG